MKKHLLSLAMIMVTAAASAQFTIWEDDFNDGNVTDWNLLNLDGNTSSWYSRKNIQINDTNSGIIDGNKDILGTYNINFNDLQYLGTPENNWAISPAIDLSYYGGTISLILNAQCAVYDGPFPLPIEVYASASPEQNTFVSIGTITMMRISPDEEEFMDYSVDISRFSGESQIYFALAVTVNHDFVGAEINSVRIDAETILSVPDTKTAAVPSVITQNPVAETLNIKLGTNFTINDLNVSIYNVNGMLVKEAKYSDTGITVSNLYAGFYFAVLSDGTTTEKLKFIKK